MYVLLRSKLYFNSDTLLLLSAVFGSMNVEYNTLKRSMPGASNTRRYYWILGACSAFVHLSHFLFTVVDAGIAGYCCDTLLGAHLEREIYCCDALIQRIKLFFFFYFAVIYLLCFSVLLARGVVSMVTLGYLQKKYINVRWDVCWLHGNLRTILCVTTVTVK